MRLRHLIALIIAAAFILSVVKFTVDGIEKHQDNRNVIAPAFEYRTEVEALHESTTVRPVESITAPGIGEVRGFDSVTLKSGEATLALKDGAQVTIYGDYSVKYGVSYRIQAVFVYEDTYVRAPGDTAWTHVKHQCVSDPSRGWWREYP